MAGRKLGLSLKPISAQITKATDKLSSIRRRVSSADRIEIDLEIRELNKLERKLKSLCIARMNVFYKIAREKSRKPSR